VLASIDVEAVAKDIFAGGSRHLKFQMPIALSDRVYGRPAQNVSLSGGLVHAHTAWRPLANLSDDEVQLLESITKKLGSKPDLNALPNGPGNQTESKPAIEAVSVE
jgi:hypothetical protein